MDAGGSDKKPRSIATWLVVAGVLGLGVFVGGVFLAQRYLARDGQLPDDAYNAIGPLPKKLGDREINATVEHNRAFIRQKCWEPALESRSKPGRAQARVEAALTILPNGTVEKVDAAEDDAFPGLSECITKSVEKWKFPPARNKTSVDLPFVFAGQ